MKDKEKVIFWKYDLTYKGMSYKILKPVVIPTEAYVSPGIEADFFDGNHVLFKLLRGIAVALIRNSEYVFYLPSGDNTSIYKNWFGDTISNYDVVLYCHNTQLNRHRFEILKKMLPYTKPVQLTTSYSISGMMDYCKKEYGRYENSKAYYSKKSDWRTQEYHGTYFAEGSQVLFCESFIEICDLTRKWNLEEYTRKNFCSPYCFAFGFEIGYVSRAIMKYWDTPRWSDVTDGSS